jgi:hypothetical protein
MLLVSLSTGSESDEGSDGEEIESRGPTMSMKKNSGPSFGMMGTVSDEEEEEERVSSRKNKGAEKTGKGKAVDAEAMRRKAIEKEEAREKEKDRKRAVAKAEAEAETAKLRSKKRPTVLFDPKRIPYVKRDLRDFVLRPPPDGPGPVVQM